MGLPGICFLPILEFATTVTAPVAFCSLLPPLATFFRLSLLSRSLSAVTLSIAFLVLCASSFRSVSIIPTSVSSLQLPRNVLIMGGVLAASCSKCCMSCLVSPSSGGGNVFPPLMLIMTGSALWSWGVVRLEAQSSSAGRTIGNDSASPQSLSSSVPGGPIPRADRRSRVGLMSTCCYCIYRSEFPILAAHVVLFPGLFLPPLAVLLL